MDGKYFAIVGLISFLSFVVFKIAMMGKKNKNETPGKKAPGKGFHYDFDNDNPRNPGDQTDEQIIKDFRKEK